MLFAMTSRRFRIRSKRYLILSSWFINRHARHSSSSLINIRILRQKRGLRRTFPTLLCLIKCLRVSIRVFIAIMVLHHAHVIVFGCLHLEINIWGLWPRRLTDLLDDWFRWLIFNSHDVWLVVGLIGIFHVSFFYFWLVFISWKTWNYMFWMSVAFCFGWRFGGQEACASLLHSPWVARGEGCFEGPSHRFSPLETFLLLRWLNWCILQLLFFLLL